MNTSGYTAHAPEDGVSMRVFAFEAIGIRWETEAHDARNEEQRAGGKVSTARSGVGSPKDTRSMGSGRLISDPTISRRICSGVGR